MKVFGKKNCKSCNGKGFITVTASAVHAKNEMVPCTCLHKVVRMTIPHAELDSYETKVETVNGVKTMFLDKKTVSKTENNVIPAVKTVEPVIPDVKPGVMPQPVIPEPAVKTVVEQPDGMRNSRPRK